MTDVKAVAERLRRKCFERHDLGVMVEQEDLCTVLDHLEAVERDNEVLRQGAGAWIEEAKTLRERLKAAETNLRPLRQLALAVRYTIHHEGLSGTIIHPDHPLAEIACAYRICQKECSDGFDDPNASFGGRDET